MKKNDYTDINDVYDEIVDKVSKRVNRAMNKHPQLHQPIATQFRRIHRRLEYLENLLKQEKHPL